MKAITKEKLQSILDCDEEAEQLTEGILDMIHSNDESLDDIGRSVVFAIINNDAEDLLLTLCGWSIDTIIESFVGGKEI
ncbi:MAG: hypothetical protein IJ334_10390 [Clostridia bacterium]|jgi:hypothetical protein|nr:hypothetical protein [Clostridia bacterium]